MSLTPEDFARRLAEAIPQAPVHDSGPARMSVADLDQGLTNNFETMLTALTAADHGVKDKFGGNASVRHEVYNHDLQDGLVYGCVIATKPHTPPRRFDFKVQGERIWFRDFPFEHNVSGTKIVRTDYDSESIAAVLERLLQALTQYFTTQS